MEKEPNGEFPEEGDGVSDENSPESGTVGLSSECGRSVEEDPEGKNFTAANAHTPSTIRVKSTRKTVPAESPPEGFGA